MQIWSHFKMVKISNTFLCALLVVTFSGALSSQTKIPDTNFAEYKGKVKSLVTSMRYESGYADWLLNQRMSPENVSSFDKDGYTTEKVVNEIETKYIFSDIDGYRTFKMVSLRPKKQANRFTVVGPTRKDEPIEPGEKLTKPDSRFDFKTVYETDDNGRVTFKRLYTNTGKLSKKQSFEYGDSGHLKKEILEDSASKSVYSYTYDENGILIETKRNFESKLSEYESINRTIYSDYKFDSIGNWIERRVTVYDEHSKNEKNRPSVSIEYRSFTYY